MHPLAGYTARSVDRRQQRNNQANFLLTGASVCHNIHWYKPQIVIFISINHLWIKFNNLIILFAKVKQYVGGDSDIENVAKTLRLIKFNRTIEKIAKIININ
ncbi:unnamed protein product [Ceratitis capitata]|uniref:(Mediterranean fruit fly) hypothetical protein n=1 Tax=Ceratitis capitata TaxID=7213 RepID=A0A811UTI1_CERCA|nr:unnamed protein product [Ceratitis capitata]